MKIIIGSSYAAPELLPLPRPKHRQAVGHAGTIHSKLIIQNSVQSHQFLDYLALAYQRAIAEKLRRDPQLMRVAFDNLERWLSSGAHDDGSKKLLLKWKRCLETLPLESVIELMLEPTEKGNQRRQSSPFAGILSKEERLRIYQQCEAEAVAGIAR